MLIQDTYQHRNTPPLVHPAVKMGCQILPGNFQEISYLKQILQHMSMISRQALHSFRVDPRELVFHLQSNNLVSSGWKPYTHFVSTCHLVFVSYQARNQLNRISKSNSTTHFCSETSQSIRRLLYSNKRALLPHPNSHNKPPPNLSWCCWGLMQDHTVIQTAIYSLSQENTVRQ